MTATETVSARASVDGASFDGAKAEAFGGHIMSILTGSLLSSMVDIGHRTGLFAAAAEGPATSEQLAARAGLCERYVREWLGAVTTGGIIEYDPATGAFFLLPEHAALLTTPAGVGPLAVANTVLAGHLHQIVRVFREGGGVPYTAFTPEFTDTMDAMGRGVFDTMLLDGYLPLAPGLADTLAAGAHVADAAGAGLTNVAFEVADVARLAATAPFDVVFVFDALHDQVRPDAVLARIH